MAFQIVITQCQRRTQEPCYIYNKLFGTIVNIFQFFYLQLSERDLSSMYQGSWIRLWTVTSLFCSMSRVAGWRLLRKITKHASLLYLCIFENFLRKLEKRLWRDLSRESCGIRDHNLLQGRFNTDNLLEI